MISSAIYNKGKAYSKYYELSGVFPLLSRTALMNMANSGTVILDEANRLLSVFIELSNR